MTKFIKLVVVANRIFESEFIVIIVCLYNIMTNQYSNQLLFQDHNLLLLRTAAYLQLWSQ